MKRKTLILVFVLATVGMLVAFFEFKSHRRADDRGATPEGISAVASADNRVALDLYSAVKGTGNENVFFSPYSISTALAITYEGARGKTAKEIQSVFQFPEDSATRRSSFAAIYNRLNERHADYLLYAANALWVKKDYRLLPEFVEGVERFYAGRAAQVDFAGSPDRARNTINKWVRERTNDKIPNLVEHSLDPATRVVLTDAIYFKGKWANQFDPESTSEEDFKVNPGKTVKVPMMNFFKETAGFGYAETGDLQILAMPYKGGDLSMVILLPKQSDLGLLEKALNLDTLKRWISNLQDETVQVHVPKFALDSSYVLNEPLKKMGMPSAFVAPGRDSGADFSGINDQEDLFLGLVVHKAFIAVDEAGTEAAAATRESLGPTTAMAPPVPPPVFKADHPFIFLIQERQTGNMLFLGRVVDPSLEAHP